MKNKFTLFLQDYYKKFILIALLVPVFLVFDRIDFPKVETTIRDALQYTNKLNSQNLPFATVNIDLFQLNQKRPIRSDILIESLELIKNFQPKKIVLLIDPDEIAKEDKEKFYTYLTKTKSVALNAQIINDRPQMFFTDPVFSNYKSFFKFTLATDYSFGARDGKHRRAMLSFDKMGIEQTITQIEELGISTKHIDNFKYNYRLWQTTQAYMKSFPVGTFGSYQVSQLKANSVGLNLADKVILLGAFDEWSFLSHPSVFDISGKMGANNFHINHFPIQDSVANLIYLYSSGDYIKFLSSINDLVILFVIFTLIVLHKADLKTKVYQFMLAMPAAIIITLLLYILGSFYIDISRSIVLMALMQYLGAPIALFYFFKKQEQEKIIAVTEARIDALLLVSEKLAHDIRSPLSAINLILSKVNVPNPEYSDILKNSISRIDEIAAKILTKYKTTVDQKTEIFDQLNLNKIIQDLISEKKLLNEKIEYNLTQNETASIAYGYKLELERILSNIVDNSIHALENTNNAVIQIILIETQTTIKIKILDNGCGVPKYVLSVLGSEKISTGGTANKVQRSGIGLLHAKRTVDRMKGSLEIESESGVGTTVTISLKKQL